MSELVARQNVFLHHTMTTSMVSVGMADENFNTEGEGEEYFDGTTRELAMAVKMDSNNYLFHSVEPGQKGQSFFLHEKDR